MFDQMADWILSVIGVDYNPVRGAWDENSSDKNKKFFVVQGNGGLAPMTDVRKPRFRVVLLGRRGQRQDAGDILSKANDLMIASLGGSVPCGAANLRSLGEPVGPGFTTENRAWVQVDFEVII